MDRYDIGFCAIILSWILLVVMSIFLIKSCRIKYEIIPQTIQIESFTHNRKTHEYVKEFSYYDKKRNIHTITSSLFIDPESDGCDCGIDYNYMKDGNIRFKETCGQLIKLSTKQKYRIEHEHLWYTSNSRIILLTIFGMILGMVLTIITNCSISDRLVYYEERYSCCFGCEYRCRKDAKCIWGKLVDDEGCKKVNKFFGFM